MILLEGLSLWSCWTDRPRYSGDEASMACGDMRMRIALHLLHCAKCSTQIPRSNGLYQFSGKKNATTVAFSLTGQNRMAIFRAPRVGAQCRREPIVRFSTRRRGNHRSKRSAINGDWCSDDAKALPASHRGNGKCGGRGTAFWIFLIFAIHGNRLIWLP